LTKVIKVEDVVGQGIKRDVPVWKGGAARALQGLAASWHFIYRLPMPSPTSPFVNSEALRSIVRRRLHEWLHSEAAKAPETPTTTAELFHSPAVSSLKEQIVEAGRKLWIRAYVDGNGGNLSARISDDLVLCTPTLCSKGDLRSEELSIVDLENRQLYGARPQTSEILLHLEIYKTVPEARAVIHCHPPYATAHAVAGVIPQGNLIPEQEVFVGPVALAPYETPGTKEFARTVVPFVRQHNTILLANHGIVCWADTVSHAEWYAEVMETYCKTIMIASRLRSPCPEIPPGKIGDLLEIKKKLGLPDARLPLAPDRADRPVTPSRENAGHQGKAKESNSSADRQSLPPDVETLVDALTAEILKHLEEKA
jgi:L-fuculose-phosphate aldolase